MEIKRAYRFGFYPTPEQEQSLARTFGCTRFAYNYMLRERTNAWRNERRRVGYPETSALLTQLKKTPEHIWLNEVSSVPLQQSLRHLNKAFGNFFARRSQYPNFRKKDGKQSAEYTKSAFKWHQGVLSLAKAGALRVRFSKTIPRGADVTTVTVSKDPAGRYFVSMLCADTVAKKARAGKAMGIDLGLTHFATLSTGKKLDNPKVFAENERKLARAQRVLARKRKGSANRKKAKLKVARLHARISDLRKDFLHQLSTRLINENQVIFVETLSVRNMQKNHCLAKAISDASWSEFVRQLEYKARWYGRMLVKVDRWFPSSKRCSECGTIAPKIPLSVREWCCPECGKTHDRDVNAARNILTAGLAGLVCGENVSPVPL